MSFRRVAKLLRGVALGLVFVTASALFTALHLGLPPGRRVAARALEVLLARVLGGSFEVGRISELTAWSVAVDRFVARDPKQRVVLDASGVRARADVLGIVREVLKNDGKTTIVVAYSRVDRVAVTLAPEAGGSELGLAAAFTPRSKTPKAAGAKPVRLWFANAEIGRGKVTSELVGLPRFTGDVNGARGQVLVSPVGVAVDAAQFSATIHGLLAQDLRAVGSFHERGTTHFWSSLDGFAGDVQFDGVARLDGKRLVLTLDVPRAEPAAVRALLPAWPLEQATTVHVEARGDLPKLVAKAQATIGRTGLAANGTLEFAPSTRLTLAAHGDAIDLRALFPNAPETSFSADTTLVLGTDARGAELVADGKTDAAAVAGVPVPATNFRATYDASGLAGTATLHEPGLPLEGSFSLKNAAFDADVRAGRFELARAPRLARVLGARGGAAFRLKARVARGDLDATLTGDVDGFGLGAFTLGRGHVTARAQGPVAAPKTLRLDAGLDGKDARFGELVFDDVSIHATGPAARLALSAELGGRHGVHVSAKTRVAALGATRFDDVDLVVARDTTSLHARAGHVALAENSLEASDVKLEGAGGTLEGSGRYRPGLLEVDARGKDLDLGLISHVVGFSGRGVAGKLDVNAEVSLARDVRRGTLEASVHDGSYGGLAGATVELSTTLEEESLQGTALFDVSGLGRARGAFDMTVTGPLLSTNDWLRATGRCDLGIENLELARLLPLLPAAWQVSELGGTAIGQVSVLRSGPEDPPSVTFLAATQGLTLAQGAVAAPVRVSGVQAELSGDVDGKQGFLQGTVHLIDATGLLASASGRLDLDVKRALGDPAGALGLLRSEPVVASLVVAQRTLDGLPSFVRPGNVLGTLSAEADVRGTLAEPELSARASVSHLTLGDDPEIVPFDACGTLQYDPLAAKIGLGLQAYVAGDGPACSGVRVAVASATGGVDTAAFARGERAFRGEAELSLEDLPLDLVPELAEAGMSGRARGVVAFTGDGDLPALNARLKLADVAVRKMPVGAGDLTLRTDGRAVALGLTLERAGGTLKADAHAGLAWSGNAPVLDRSLPIAVSSEIHDVDAGILTPIVGGVLADLGGRLDGAVALTLAPSVTTPGAPAAVNALSGKLTLADGSFQLGGLGMRLSKVRFDATAARSGNRTVISVRNLAAASGTKYANVSADVDLYLAGLHLEDARATANLKNVPLMIQGVSQATLTGGATLELFPERDPMLVAISLHDLTAALPRTSGRAVLGVDDNPDISVKQPLREPLRAARGEALKWELAFDLARKVRITRSDMEIPLRGRPVIELDDKTRVSGDLELESGGRVQLLGKGFVIESGEVHFDTPDPSDPHLRVLASWRAPDGTTVYVDVGGTMRQATLRLESDPSLTQPEIQALLLGGSSNSSGGEAQAAGLGYGADFMGQLLADTPLKQVEIRTGNETTADDLSYATYSAVVPVGDNVWVELSYKNLEGTGPAEQRDAASAIIDWRFKRDWSLRTEAGTIGTGLDLLWQYRY
ncbi:MAG TPA: translocation/assembly module TamB domain-containing protein [Polyangiaceae bacterium]|nr:translocation/assembly module TamB domain-containing protein [Polyangiaceae bacterium]